MLQSTVTRHPELLHLIAACVPLLALLSPDPALGQYVLGSVHCNSAPYVETSDLKQTANPINQEVAMAGGLQGGVFSRTLTQGIYLATFAAHPGRTFVMTSPFSVRGSSQGGTTTRQGTAFLKRGGYWRMDALRPDLIGTQGTMRWTLRWSWDVRRSRVPNRTAGSGSATLSHYNGPYSTASSVKSPDMGDIAVLEARMTGGETYVTGHIPFYFGSSFSAYWGVDAFSSSYDGVLNFASATVKLWKVEVFDAAGNKLTRFSDYEWWEVCDPAYLIVPGGLAPVATGEMVETEPGIDIIAAGGGIALDWPTNTGLSLFSSPSLAPGSWVPVDTSSVFLADDRWSISLPMVGQRQFYQLRSAP